MAFHTRECEGSVKGPYSEHTPKRKVQGDCKDKKHSLCGVLSLDNSPRFLRTFELAEDQWIRR